jgi:hypothetical protein
MMSHALRSLHQYLQRKKKKKKVEAESEFKIRLRELTPSFKFDPD